MPVANVKSSWKSGDLVFEKYLATANPQVEFGIDGTGLDVKFWGDTASAYMLWDESGNALLFAGGASLNLEGTITLALGIGSTTALTTATTARNAVKVQSNFSGNGYHIANFFVSQYTSDGASYGTVRALVGQADLEATQTTVSSAQYMVGVHGRAKVSGTAYNSSLFVTGVHAQILDGGTWTACSHVSALWADNQLNQNVVAGQHELIYMSNNNAGAQTVDQAMYLYGPYTTNFIKMYGCTVGGMVASSSTAGTMTYTVKCNIDGTTAYLHFYNA